MTWRGPPYPAGDQAISDQLHIAPALPQWLRGDRPAFAKPCSIWQSNAVKFTRTAGSARKAGLPGDRRSLEAQVDRPLQPFDTVRPAVDAAIEVRDAASASRPTG